MSPSPEPKKVRTEGEDRSRGIDTTTFSSTAIQEEFAGNVPLTTFAAPPDLRETPWDTTAGGSAQETNDKEAQEGAACKSMHPGGTEDGTHTPTKDLG